jgi:two-component system, cell cycle sensor histidine kinase and response regulator CckA
MPGMPARQLADRLQAERPGTPVVYMSGYSAETVADRPGPGLSAPLLQKPFSPA